MKYHSGTLFHPAQACQEIQVADRGHLYHAWGPACLQCHCSPCVSHCEPNCASLGSGRSAIVAFLRWIYGNILKNMTIWGALCSTNVQWSYPMRLVVPMFKICCTDSPAVPRYKTDSIETDTKYKCSRHILYLLQKKLVRPRYCCIIPTWAKSIGYTYNIHDEY